MKPEPRPHTSALSVTMLAGMAGAAVLVVELAAGRMVAPVFGGSIEVWAVVIAVTMAALAVGYAVGGALADRRGGLVVAYGAAGASAVMIAILPLVRAPLLKAFADLPTAPGTFGAVLFLVFPPLAALGMVSPALVRGLADADTVGRSTGRIYAISTVGSMIGALLAGLVLLPEWPVAWVLLGTAGGLALAVIPGWPLAGMGSALVIGGVSGWWALAPPPLPRVVPEEGPPITVVAREPSPFGEVRVIERGSHRLMLSNGMDQGGIDVKTRVSAYSVPRLLVGLIPLYRPDPLRRVLVVGLGPGVVSTELDARGVYVDSVEIDPTVVRMAREWFDFDGPVQVEDGRRVVRLATNSWDAIIIDAFLSGNPPWHLFTREAFQDYKAHLAPGGLVVLNVIGHADDPAQKPALHAVLATAASVFANAEAWPDPFQSADYPILNLYVVATDADRRPLTARDAARQKVPPALLAIEPIPAGTGVLLSDTGRSLQPLIVATARHVRIRSAAYLPVEIRVD